LREIALIMAKAIELRIKVIDAVEKGKNIADAAQDYGTSVWTIRRWLKKYRAGGLEQLTQPRPYIPPWNITPKEIAEKVYLLKENDPKITLSQAKEKLSKKGVNLSLACIRKIWRRYGLGGYDKEKQTAELVPNIPFPQDVKIAINEANKILEQNGDVNPVRILDPLQSATGPDQRVGHSNGVKEAAQVLNRLPYCGGAEILDKIPYRYLKLRRRVEKIPYLFYKEPLHKLYKRVRSLRLNLEKRGLFYSSLRAGMAEANALFWMGKPRQTIALIKTLEHRLPKQGDPMICFILTLFKGMASSRLLELNHGFQCANECKRLIKVFSDPSFHIGLGNLYTNIGMYLQAKACYQKAIQNASGTTYEQGLLSLAGCYALNGEYQKTLKILKQLEQKHLPAYTLIPLARAQSLLGQGMMIEAAQYAKTAIEIAQKNEILQYLHTSTMVLSAIYYALGEKKRAKALIKGTTPLLKKTRMIQDYYIRMLLLDKKGIFISKRYKSEPFIKLILLMKQANQTRRLRDYNCALRFAIRKGLKGFFHRLCIFNSEIVLKLMEKGKPTGLPKAILGFPIFNRNLPVFHISFLGTVKIYRTESLLKAKLRPKDAAFLIHLSLSRGHRLSSEVLCQNFWEKSKDAESNLYHLLWRLRKTLGISSCNLYTKGGNISFEGFLTTDFQKFEETLTIARALGRNGRWQLAQREYKRAFSLFRGEPFKKMYDQWSEDMRHRILSQFENSVLEFAKECLEHKNQEDIQKVLNRVSKIIPDSDKIQRILSRLP
jgi:DNA-binding SARP family transcriptional activator/transposase